MKVLDDRILSQVIKPRPKDSHKGNYGRVLLVGGNAQYGGAIILAASAAVYSGAGLVTVATDRVNHASLHARLPEAMVIDWNEEFLTTAYDVVVVGCGLGLGETELNLFNRLLAAQTEEQWLVIDGSAISLFAEHDLNLKYPNHVVFTPHQMELQRLSGIQISEQTETAIQSFAEKRGTTIVAKSSASRIFAAKKEPYLLNIGSPAQATGGMGDTLAGMIGGFLAQFRNDGFDTIAAATYLHSKIASELVQKAYVVLPSQIIRHIPEFMKKSEN